VVAHTNVGATILAIAIGQTVHKTALGSGIGELTAPVASEVPLKPHPSHTWD